MRRPARCWWSSSPAAMPRSPSSCVRRSTSNRSGSSPPARRERPAELTFGSVCGGVAHSRTGGATPALDAVRLRWGGRLATFPLFRLVALALTETPLRGYSLDSGEPGALEVGALAILLTAASAADAAMVSLPSNATITAVGQTTVVNISIGSVTDVEALG